MNLPIFLSCILLISLYSCKKPVKMGMATQNAVVRETRFDRQPAGRPSFLFTLRKTDEDGRPAQIEIQIKNEHQIKQIITHKPNYWR